MARLPRLSVPGLPHHALLCGNNKQPVFLDDTDRNRFVAVLTEVVGTVPVQLHAYVLLTAEVRLLLTPMDATALSRLMQALGRRYVSDFNRRHGRSGTLWEGRFRSTVLQPERYLLPCQVMMDTAAEEEGWAAGAAAYPWSSHRHYLGQRHDKWLTAHPEIWRLGNTPFAREAAYAKAVAVGVPGPLRHTVMDASLKGWALGDPPFLTALAQQTPRRLTEGRPGRPRN